MADLSVKRRVFISSKSVSIEEDYELGAKIGTGGFGEVFEATNKTSGQKFAIKRVAKSRITDSERLETEIKILKETDHPSIIRLYEIFEEAYYVNLVMEHCSGGELFDYVLLRRRLSEKQASSLFLQVVSAVRYLHSNGIVHRDLKPENLLFSDDSMSVLKLCDFGLSKLMTKTDSITPSSIGSPFYVSPEIINRQEFSYPCDIWSLGVILYMLLSGIPPFYAHSTTVVLHRIKMCDYNFERPEWNLVSEEAKDLISKLIVLNPEERLTIEEIVVHPWLQTVESLSEEPLDLDMSGLNEYKTFLDLKKAMLMCIASHCSESEIKGLREIFMKIDTNGDGTISLEELKQGISHLNINMKAEEIMSAMDVNGDNQIDYTEFVAATLNRSLLLQQSKILEAFRLFDKDSSGSITPNEICEILGQEDPHNASFWNRLMQEIDANADGSIDLQEFLDMMVGKTA